MAWEDRVISQSAAVERTRKRSVERSRALIDAAKQHFYDGGDQITVQQIAGQAGVSLQTFYRYFPGKDELLLAVFEDDLRIGVENIRLTAMAEEDPLDRLRSVIVQPVSRILVENPARARLVTREHHRLAERFPREVEQAIQLYVDLVREVVDGASGAGLIALSNPNQVTLNIALLVLTRFHHAAWGMFVEDPEAEAEGLWETCRRALGGVEPGAPAT